MPRASAQRTWCARLRYPGLEPFLFGTAVTGSREGEEAARQAIMREALVVLPSGFDVLDLLPGVIVFQPEAVDA